MDRKDQALKPLGMEACHSAFVLLATRDLSLKAFGTTALKAAGFRVEVREEAGEIVRGFDQEAPDLILLDLTLDGTQTLEVCRAIRHQPRGRSIPILVLSNAVHPGIIHEVFEIDNADLVRGPVNWLVLSYRVRDAIRRSRLLANLSESQSDLEVAQLSARQASEEALMLRNYDKLTGLPSRAMFTDTLGLALAQGERGKNELAVLFVDLVGFKHVNEAFGRETGDRILVAVSKRLQGSLRDRDLLVRSEDAESNVSFSRLTGDQFAILITHLNERADAERIAERCAASMSRPVRIDGREIFLSVKMGIATSPEHGKEEEVLVNRAEMAMRFCKHQPNASFCVFESHMAESAAHRFELENELRKALEAGELTLFYQPIVDTRSRELTSAEGLLRWQHPEKGLLAPGQFLPFAEESDLITQIDQWVLAHGCRRLRDWIEQGIPPFKISLNVSKRFIEKATFAASVTTILRETGLDPALLQIELSERGALPDSPQTIRQFEALRELGVSLAIDDFGTGQTTLTYLTRFPFNVVKIDRSFVSGLPEDPASMAITSAIVAMSHRLEMGVVGEGVEEEKQVVALEDHGCDGLQGYLFARPLSAADFERRIAASATTPAPRPLPEERPEERPDERPDEVPERPTRGSADEAGRQEPTPLPEPLPGKVPEQQPEQGPTQVPAAMPTPPTLPQPDQLPGIEEILAAAEAPTPADPRPAARQADTPPGTQLDERFQQLARNDYLTRLFNRFGLGERLEVAIAHARRFNHPVALFMLDLDHFKEINDTCGHAAGDQVLIAIADRLRRKMRKTDTLARFGGDEFVIVQSEVGSIEGLGELARRLLAIIAEPIVVDGRELRTTASIGVSVSPAGEPETQVLLEQADLALYQSKDEGGNTFRFHAREMDEKVKRTVMLRRDLEGAALRDELSLVYQPQFNLADRSVVAAEALLRWVHPALGPVDPQEIVAVAEGSGQMLALGEWVLTTACSEAKRWQRETAKEIAISVNLSIAQVRDPEFAAMVGRILGETGLAPERLELDLTEEILTGASRDAESTLNRLHDLGVTFCFGDFGYGSSALEHFTLFTFDRLKLDRRFVRAMRGKLQDDAVVSAVVALAGKLGMEIVAEGIETREQLKVLAAAGCQVGQGFLFSRPLLSNDLEALLSGNAEPGEKGNPAADILPFETQL